MEVVKLVKGMRMKRAREKKNWFKKEKERDEEKGRMNVEDDGKIR